MAFKDLCSFEKEAKEGPDCKDKCPNTEFSKELTPKTDTKEDCDTCKK
ncbi:MAG: hypothetical protein AAGU23_06425 [Bacillota bacterium]